MNNIEKFIEVYDELLKNKNIKIEDISTKVSKKYKIICDNRIETVDLVHKLLLNKKLKYTTKIVTGSSFPATIVDFPTGGKVKNIIFQYKPKKSLSIDAKTTAMQEKASAYVFERVLKDNITWKSLKDMLDDKITMDGIKKIYPSVNDEWLEVFWKQHVKMFDEFSNTRWNIFDHSGKSSFMQYITEVVNKKFGISKKDNWNPSDIWMIKTSVNDIKKIIEDTISGSKESQTILELNTVLRSLYKERKLVGISLKKISGKQAHYEEYNIKDLTLDEIDEYNFPNVDVRINLTENMTQDTVVKLTKNDGKGFKFQIKGNQTTGFSNLKWESTPIGATSARGGKAEVDGVVQLLKESGRSFDKSNSSYPKSLDEYLKREKEFIAMFDRLKNLVETGVNSSEEFTQNIKKIFYEEPHKANSKLIQLAFLDEIYKIPLKKRLEVWTDIVFLSIKKGNRYGPYGKLY